MEETTVTGRLRIHPLLEATKTFRDFRVVMFNNSCSKITICRSCTMEGEILPLFWFHTMGLLISLLNRIVGWLGKFGEGGRKLSNLLGAVTISGLFSSFLEPPVQRDSPASSAAAFLPWFNCGCVETGVLSLKCIVIAESLLLLETFQPWWLWGEQCDNKFCWKGPILGRQI